TVIKSAGIRCSQCNRKLAELASAPYRFTCPKCKAVTEDSTVPDPVKSADPMLGLTEALMALATREQPTPQITVPLTIAEGAVQAHVNVPTPGPRETTFDFDDNGKVVGKRERPIPLFEETA